MSRTRISGWGLLLVLAAMPAVLWMGSGAAPEEGDTTAGVTVSAAGFAGDGPALAGGPTAGDGVVGDRVAGDRVAGDRVAGDRVAGDRASSPRGAAGESDLALLRDRLIGSFGSGAQAAADSSYSDIRLHIVAVWPHRSDAHWMYAEQAAASSLDKPQWMRVYRLSQIGPDLFESRVFRLPNESRFAGAWRKQFPLGSVTPDSLLPCAGSSIVLRRGADGVFMGSTLGHDGESDLRGAAYATSELRVEADRMLRWDRGFDAAGTQVWGAAKGPYDFQRIPG